MTEPAFAQLALAYVAGLLTIPFAIIGYILVSDDTPAPPRKDIAE